MLGRFILFPFSFILQTVILAYIIVFSLIQIICQMSFPWCLKFELSSNSIFITILQSSRIRFCYIVVVYHLF